jgi:DNA-binding IclR family transcriptional regulator
MHKRTIQSLVRANDILEAIAGTPDGCARLIDIQHATGLHKNTAFSILQTLEQLQYVERAENGKRYRLGLRVLQLGRLMDRQFDLPAIVRPALVRLCRETGETVNLALPYALDALVVSSLEGSYGVRATSYTGWRIYYHAGALGKAMLAHYGEKHRKAITEGRALESFTPNTVTDEAELERQLVTIRRNGYALDLEEFELGATAVAAPVLDSHGQVLGAISVSGPISRLSEARLHETAPLIVAEIGAIAPELP